MAGYRARAVFLAASFVAAAAAHAGTYKWTGLGADADLQTGANWDFPGLTADAGFRYVVFNNASAARLTANNRTANFVVQNLSLLAANASYNITGSAIALGGFVAQSAGTNTISAPITASGSSSPWMIQGGSLSVTGQLTLAAAVTFNLSNGASISVDSIGASTRALILTSAAGGGTAVLGNVSSTGGITLNSGATLLANTSTSLGGSGASLIAKGGTLRAGNDGLVFDNVLDLSNTGSLTFDGLNSASFGRQTPLVAPARPVNVNGTGRLTLAAGVNSTSGGGLTKGGGGVLELRGDSSINGTYTVSSGTLLVNGTLTHTGSSGGISVAAAGAVLGGTGSVRLASGRTVNLAGTLSPGEPGAIGAFTFGTSTVFNTLQLAASSVLHLDITAAGTDQVVVNGPLDLRASETLEISNPTNRTGQFAILQYRSLVSGSSFSRVDYNGTVYTLGDALCPVTVEYSAAAATLTVVPEPSVLLGLAMLSMSLAVRPSRPGRL